MSTLTVQSTWDVAKARNMLRQVILGQKWSPTLCARAVAVFATFGELILGSRNTGTFEILIVPRKNKPGVELNCIIAQHGADTLPLETVQSQLKRAGDVVEIHQDNNQVAITVYLWRDKTEVRPDNRSEG